MIESIQKAVIAELDRTRELPLRYREDARAAVSHALASHLVDCTLRQGAAEAVLLIGGYEVIVRPVAGAQVAAEEADAVYTPIDMREMAPEGFADAITGKYLGQPAIARR